MKSTNRRTIEFTTTTAYVLPDEIFLRTNVVLEQVTIDSAKTVKD
jgi:hypothetical protein